LAADDVGGGDCFPRFATTGNESDDLRFMTGKRRQHSEENQNY
jgi:hypothetical protein